MALPRDVAPGDALDVDVVVAGSLGPGRYRLRYDMVTEGVTWFEFQGSPCAHREIEIDLTCATPKKVIRSLPHPAESARRIAWYRLRNRSRFMAVRDSRGHAASAIRSGEEYQGQTPYSLRSSAMALTSSPRCLGSGLLGVTDRLFDVSDLVALLIESEKKAAESARLTPAGASGSQHVARNPIESGVGLADDGQCIARHCGGGLISWARHEPSLILLIFVLIAGLTLRPSIMLGIAVRRARSVAANWDFGRVGIRVLMFGSLLVAAFLGFCGLYAVADSWNWFGRTERAYALGFKVALPMSGSGSVRPALNNALRRKGCYYPRRGPIYGSSDRWRSLADCDIDPRA